MLLTVHSGVMVVTHCATYCTLWCNGGHTLCYYCTLWCKNRETDILSKGLSFIPYTPNINYIKSSEIIDFTNKLRLRYKYMHITPSDNPFRLKTKQTPGPTDYKPLEKLIDNITLTLSQIKSTTGRPNLPKDGMCLIHRLKNQHEVIINQADKGSTIVLLDRKTYVAEGHKHLADPETYTRLEHDITDKIKQTIETKLDNLYKSGLLTKRQCEFCYPPESHRTSLMYFLIKLHKNPHTYRPICSCVNSITANISGFLDFWLKQAVVLLPTYIRDTTHLIQTLEKHTFCKDIILCTVDVTNMYTNIPTAEGNQAAIRALTTLKNSTPMPDMAVLAELLDIVTKNNVFEFNGEFYLQTRGVPMGNIMAPSYSGIFMGELEQKIIQPHTDKIKLWIRYIDDILILWSGNQEEFQSFLLNCNKLHPTIKFTGECSPSERHFLDVTIYKGTNFQNKQILDTKTYTKPTNKQTYVHSSSFHPKGTGKSIALGEAHRILRTNSDEGNFRQQIIKLQKALLARGYKEKATKTLLKKIYFKDRERVIHKQNLKTDKQGTPVMAITYNTHVPLVRDALRKLWVDVKRDPVLSGLFPAPPRIALKKNRSLRDMLVRARLKKETPLGFNPPC